MKISSLLPSSVSALILSLTISWVSPALSTPKPVDQKLGIAELEQQLADPANNQSNEKRQQLEKLFLEHGTPEAQYAFALHYIDAGFDVIAMPLLRAASDGGNINAQNLLADNYVWNKRIKRDAVEALRLSELIIATPSTDPFILAQSHFRIGHIYQYGFAGIKKNLIQTKAHYERAAAILYDAANGSKEKHDGWYLQLAKQGDPIGFNHFKHRADRGDAEAQYEIGLIYIGKARAMSHNIGFGSVEVSEADGIKYLKMASDQGLAKASYRLAFFHYSNRMDDKNDTEKYYKLLDSVQKNSNASPELRQKALIRLGDLFITGHGSAKKSLNAAAHYYQKARYPDGLYETGSGFAAAGDYDNAISLYYEAASLGNTYAMVDLALCYFEGNGVEQSENFGMQWLNKAVEKGDEDAIEIVAEIKELRLKASQGNKEAVEELKQYGLDYSH